MEVRTLLFAVLTKQAGKYMAAMEVINIVIANRNFDLFHLVGCIETYKRMLCNIIPSVLCVVDGKLDSDFTNLL